MTFLTARLSHKIILFISSALILGAVYTLFDPAETVWMPKCPVYTLTGLNCPGCGSQRALHALLHGDIGEAFRANALLFLFVPLIITLAVGEINNKRWPRFYKAVFHPVMIYGILAIVVGWAIVRNIIY